MNKRRSTYVNRTELPRALRELDGNAGLPEGDLGLDGGKALFELGVAVGGDGYAGGVDAVGGEIVADGLGAAEREVIALAVVGAGAVRGDGDGTGGMLLHKVDYAVQLVAGGGLEMGGTGVELDEPQGQRAFELAELVERIGLGGHGGLGSGGYGHGGHIEPAGRDEGHIGLALVETERLERVEVGAVEMMHDASAVGIDNVNAAHHAGHGGQTELNGAVGLGGVVVCGG